MTSAPRLEDASYVLRDGYPLLRVTYDGREAEIGSDVHPEIIRSGFVFLGPEFKGRVPTRSITFASGEVLKLEGFSGDVRLFKLYNRFLAACNDDVFVEGPVPIPE